MGVTIGQIRTASSQGAFVSFPDNAYADELWTAFGSGFLPNESFYLAFETTLQLRLWTNYGYNPCDSQENGSFACGFTVPIVPPGDYSVCAVGEDDSACGVLNVVAIPTATALSCTEGSQSNTTGWQCEATAKYAGYPASFGNPTPDGGTGGVVMNGSYHFSSSTSTGSFEPSSECEVPGSFPVTCAFGYSDSAETAITISASFVPDSPVYAGSSGSYTLSSSTVQCRTNLLNFGANMTCSATVLGDSPNGQVEFSVSSAGDFANALYYSECTLVSGSCSITYASTDLGNLSMWGYDTCNYTMWTSYLGDANNANSFGGTAFTVVVKTPTLTTVVCNPNPVVAGSTARCTFTVSGRSPSGRVVFDSSSATGIFSDAVCYLSSGRCPVDYSDNQTGTETISGTYVGDSNNEMSKGSTTLAITPSAAASSTSVDCAPNPVGVGSETVCAVTVRGSNPTGTVTFSSSGPTGRFSSSSCILGATGGCDVSYVDNETGSVTITARYSGDSNNAVSSGSTDLVVNVSTSSLAVNCTPNPVNVGAVSTCTAVVTGALPTGRVTFSSLSPTGKFSPADCLLSGGSCFVAFDDSVAGTDQILAVYSGDSANSQASGSTNLVIQAGAVTTTPPTKAPTTTAVSCKPNPVTAFDFTTCTATVSGSSPTGNVTFSSDARHGTFPQGVVCTLSSGVCSVTFSSPQAGAVTIIAAYAGDSGNQASSGEAELVVTGIQANNNVTVNLNATVSGTFTFVTTEGTQTADAVWPTELPSPILITGETTASQFSGFAPTVDSSGQMTAIDFTVTGQAGTEAATTLTIPKSDVPPDLVPTVMIDGVDAAQQSYTQDATNFYVTFTTHFSTHTVRVQFVRPQLATTGVGPSPSPPSQWATIAAGLALVIGLPLAIVLLLVLRVKSRRSHARAGTGVAGPRMITGSAGPAGAGFCSRCGAAVMPEEAFCSNCGAEMVSGRKP